MTKTRAYTERYQYDAAGNILSLQHQNAGGGFTRNFDFIEGTNRFKALNVGSNSYQYSHDKNGNLTQENASRFFEWDHSDRLRSFHTQAGDSEPSVYSHYMYDSAGQRVKKVTRKSGANTSTTVYIDTVFEEHREHSNGIDRKNILLHIMDNDQRIAVRRVGDAFPGDNGSAVQYHFGDHLGSSNLVVDDSGSWTNREEFTPYGETSFGSFAKKRYRYNGKEKDEHSGLYYYGARYYAPWFGRWLSADPAGPVDGLNLYTYVSGNPIVSIDPTGTQQEHPQQENQPTQQGLSEAEIHNIINRTANAIAQHETGGRARPSELDTTAGIPASYASVSQTIATTANINLRRIPSLSRATGVSFTRAQTFQVIQVGNAAGAVWDAAMRAPADQTLEQFRQANSDNITTSRLNEQQVSSIFESRLLKNTIDTYNSQINMLGSLGEQKRQAREFAQAIPASDRLGLGESSLATYIRRPDKWGDNRAAWTRRAVQNIPGGIEQVLQTAAEHNNGWTMLNSVIRRRINVYVCANPSATEQDIVMNAARQHNNRGSSYARDVWRIYQGTQ